MAPVHIERSMEALAATPAVLTALLNGLSDSWTSANEGPDTWTPYDVVGHLLHLEKTDWIVRLEIVLSDRPDRRFSPVDRTAMFRESPGRAMPQLLQEFALLREKNIAALRGKDLTDEDLAKTAVHPALGEVTLAQLLAAWTVHDLTHIAQIVRVMAKQYTTAVGPWIEYLRVLRQ